MQEQKEYAIAQLSQADQKILTDAEAQLRAAGCDVVLIAYQRA